MPDSNLALADFAAKLAMLYYRTGHDPGGFRAADAMEIARLAHKYHGVNDDTERDRDLETLETLARQLECDLDLDNKALNSWDEYFNPLPIPRLDEPPERAAMTTRHLVLTHYDEESERRSEPDLFCFSAAPVEGLDRGAQFQAAYAEAFHAADGDTSDVEFDFELALRDISAEVSPGFSVHDWSCYEQCFDKEG